MHRPKVRIWPPPNDPKAAGRETLRAAWAISRQKRAFQTRKWSPSRGRLLALSPGAEYRNGADSYRGMLLPWNAPASQFAQTNGRPCRSPPLASFKKRCPSCFFLHVAAASFCRSPFSSSPAWPDAAVRARPPATTRPVTRCPGKRQARSRRPPLIPRRVRATRSWSGRMATCCWRNTRAASKPAGRTCSPAARRRSRA